MDERFDRCIYCFAPRQEGVCPACGEPASAAWQLRPGMILKGRYMAGSPLSEMAECIHYRGWDLVKDVPVEIGEFYPKALVTRNAAGAVVCAAGREAELEAGKQAFFQRVKLFYDCASPNSKASLDFFPRNGTCYYVRKPRRP